MLNVSDHVFRREYFSCKKQNKTRNKKNLHKISITLTKKISVEPTITISPGISVQGWNLKDLFRLGKSSTSRGDNGLH